MKNNDLILDSEERDKYQLVELTKGELLREIDKRIKKSTIIENRFCIETFHYGIITITRHFGYFTLHIDNFSEEEIDDRLTYVLDETEASKLSEDRILWYLSYLLLGIEFPIED